MTIGQATKATTVRLEEASVPSARLDAELLVAHVLDTDRTWVLSHDTDEMPTKAKALLEPLVARRVNREPLVHLTNQREFYGLNFYIDKDVLTPRVETEQMVEWALKLTPQDGTVIDIGTGSGAIAIAIGATRADLKLTATEVNDEALAVAERNVKALSVPMKLIKSDLWEYVDGFYDTVVTNLPYLQDDADLMPEVQREPGVALFGGPDGLDLYRRFLAGIHDHLKVGGHLFTECDPWQHEKLIDEAAKYRLRPIEQGYFILGFKLAAQ